MSEDSNGRGVNAGCSGWRDTGDKGDTTGDQVVRDLGDGAGDIESTGTDGQESGEVAGPSERSG
jgi:hypothetical protein